MLTVSRMPTSSRVPTQCITSRKNKNPTQPTGSRMPTGSTGSRKTSGSRMPSGSSGSSGRAGWGGGGLQVVQQPSACINKYPSKKSFPQGAIGTRRSLCSPL